MRCVVFELAGGGTYYVPPGRAKVAQTPGRARVNGLVLTVNLIPDVLFEEHVMLIHDIC